MKQLNTHFDPIGHRKVDERYIKYNPDIEHHVYIPPDDGKEIKFKWHFQRGLLSPRMSGYELAEFVVKHMVGIICCGFFKEHPRIENEFKAMFVQLATSRKEVLDRLLSWIKVEYHENEDDIIYMSLFDRTPQKEGKVYFT